MFNDTPVSAFGKIGDTLYEGRIVDPIAIGLWNCGIVWFRGYHGSNLIIP